MRIMMDCDTGITMPWPSCTLGSPDAELIGVTGVFGNVQESNSRGLLDCLGGRISLCMKVPANRHIGARPWDRREAVYRPMSGPMGKTDLRGNSLASFFVLPRQYIGVMVWRQ